MRARSKAHEFINRFTRSADGHPAGAIESASRFNGASGSSIDAMAIGLSWLTSMLYHIQLDCPSVRN